MVADHSENLGLAPAINEGNPDLLKNAFGNKLYDFIHAGTMEGSLAACDAWMVGMLACKDPLADQKGIA